MEQPISLNQIQMRVSVTAEAGVVNRETLFTFKQADSIVSAEYAGGKVRLGYLIGTVSDKTLRFRYVQLDTEGQLDGGNSICEIDETDDGRIRLIERFQWETREGTGVNIFEQIVSDK